MLNDPMIGRHTTRRGVLELRQLLVDAVPDGQQYAAAFDIALV